MLNTWLALNQIECFTVKKYLRIKEMLSLKTLLNAKAQSLTPLKLGQNFIAERDTIDKKLIRQSLRWLEEDHHHLVTFDDERYPPLLKAIHDPPLMLYIIGNPEILSNAQIAIVGSRKATPLGLANTALFSKTLAEAGFHITSGLALGVDGRAHEATLNVGKTIAVLGRGLFEMYPQRHTGLADKIVSHGGAIISEFPLNVTPQRRLFPKRNRIISGLSLCTLVTEASLGSGSLITAYLASDQGRDVFAIPGSIRQPQSQGCHRLIQEGAELCTHPNEILAKLSAIQATLPIKLTDNHFKQCTNPQKKQILKLLQSQTLSIDSLAELCNLTIESVSRLLTELELEQYISASAGGYCLKETQYD